MPAAGSSKRRPRRTSSSRKRGGSGAAAAASLSKGDSDLEGPRPRSPARRHKLSDHRHYKVTARSIQHPGEDAVCFRLTTPAAAGLPVDRGGRAVYRATPLGLSARPAQAKVHYSVEVLLAFQNDAERRVDSNLQNVFGEDSTLAKITKKFVDFRAKVAKLFPFFNLLPHIRASNTWPQSPGYLVFQLTLPPNTSFFVDDRHFWSSLRFPSNLVEHHHYGGVGGRKDRHGITNRSDRTLVVTTEPIHENEDPETLYWAENEAEPPESTQLRVEVEFLGGWHPQTLSEEEKLDQDSAATALDRLLRSGLALLLLDPDQVVEVDADTTPGTAVLHSKNFGQGGRLVQVSVRLSQVLADFFELSDRTLVFPSTDPRVYPLTQRTPPSDDVLEGLYPVHLVALGQPGAHHFVHGRGWVSLLGLLTSPVHFAGRTEWMELASGETELRLQLVDRWCKPVVSTCVTEFVLYLELVDLF